MIHYLMNNSLKYIGLILIIVLFGIFSIPKIYERVINSDITDSNRLHSNERLSYLTISDEKRKAPDFILTNQDSILISNEDMSGKVYVLEFFFTRCPDICIEMNQNMKSLDDKFAETDEFGIISITIDPKNDTPSILKKRKPRIKYFFRSLVINKYQNPILLNHLALHQRYKNLPIRV